ncbi:hypothetical protein BH11ARM2_BH11ARM2_05980 [soil metagenome]
MMSLSTVHEIEEGVRQWDAEGAAFRGCFAEFDAEAGDRWFE